MKKVFFVAGGCGYIGSHLVEFLLGKKHKVIVLDRFFFGNTLKDIPNKNLTVIKGDVRFVDKKILKNVDVVINLAAISNDPASELDKSITKKINYIGAVSLAKLAKESGVKRYILSSSCSVYGAGSSILDENSPLAPISEYAKSKIRAEEEILKLASKKFVVTIPRLATVYGLSPRRMRFDLIVNIMTLHAWKNKKIFVMGEGMQWRPLIHIDDAVKAFYLLAMEKDINKIQSQIFNIGSNTQNYQVYQVANFFKRYFPGLEIEVAPDGPDKRSYNVNFDKARKVLGYRTQKTIDDAIIKIKKALDNGTVTDDTRTNTLYQYRFLMEADRILSEIKLRGRLF